MPMLPNKACMFCGEPHREKTAYCKACRDSDEKRAGSARRGYNKKWQRVRASYLKLHPIVECERCPMDYTCPDFGKTIPSDTVHHIIPISANRRLRLSFNNLLAVSRKCHERIEGRLKE